MQGVARTGRERSSGLYFEILGDGSRGPDLLFIHGGGNTGDVFRSTPDGRVGWADLLARRGHRCWVTDWPATGRSGHRDLLALRYADVVEGYAALLREVIGAPVVIICHSMGGPTTWKLVESHPDLVVGVASIAAGYPGNLAPRNTTVLEDDGRVVSFRFGDTGLVFSLDRTKPYLLDDVYLLKQAIAGSTRFPMDAFAVMRGGLSALSPLMLLERVGAMPGLPMLVHAPAFAGKRIRLFAGDQDPAHTRAIEDRTAAFFADWGADAKVVWLPDRGITGNGHMLMMETNSAEVLDVVVSEIDAMR